MTAYVARRLNQLSRIILISLSRDSSQQKQAKIIAVFIEMGGVYIKFAQLLLLELNDMKNAPAAHYNFLLKKTYDSTPVESLVINDILRGELGEQASELYDVEAEPIASGSFGQVYRARLTRDNTQVIIKVAKPQVLQTLNSDLKLLAFVTRIFAQFSRNDSINIKDVFSDFARMVRRELDYESEVFNALQAYRMYKDHPNLVVPKTYEHLSTKHIIVQDYIQGLSVTEVLEQKKFGHDPVEFVREKTGSNLVYQMAVCGQEMLSAMLGDGIAHGDPHPGNIILLPDNKIAAIDFGICTSGPRNKQAFFKLVTEYKRIYVDGKLDVEAYTMAAIDLFVSELTGAIRVLDRYSSGEVSQQVFKAIQGAVASIYGSSFNEVEYMVQNHKIMHMFIAVINENNRFGLSLKIDQPEYIRATILYISLTEALGIREPVLKAVYGNVYQAFQSYQFTQPSANFRPEQAVAIIAEWLEQVASRDVFLYMLISRQMGRRVLHV